MARMSLLRSRLNDVIGDDLAFGGWAFDQSAADYVNQVTGSSSELAAQAPVMGAATDSPASGAGLAPSAASASNPAGLEFLNDGDGYLQFDPAIGDAGAGGSWVRLMTTGSTMPNSTLMVYATDLDGNMIGRDGQATANLDDAVLAQVGWIERDTPDPDVILSDGMQSVFLASDRQLHFAVQTGDDVIELLPDVQVDAHVSVPAYRSVAVDGTWGTLDLIAMIDADLPASANLASGQRETNQPWVFLQENQELSVEAKGSAGNWNTVRFVRIDVDPSTGDCSVDGVAYGNTDAFRLAVRGSASEAAASGGQGDFEQGFVYTPSTSGFYTPILETSEGDIFVFGDANVDGRDHIRMFGENTFGFEDLRADQDSDWDYNDMVVKFTVEIPIVEVI